MLFCATIFDEIMIKKPLWYWWHRLAYECDICFIFVMLLYIGEQMCTEFYILVEYTLQDLWHLLRQHQRLQKTKKGKI